MSLHWRTPGSSGAWERVLALVGDGPRLKAGVARVVGEVEVEVGAGLGLGLGPFICVASPAEAGVQWGEWAVVKYDGAGWLILEALARNRLELFAILPLDPFGS